MTSETIATIILSTGQRVTVDLNWAGKEPEGDPHRFCDLFDADTGEHLNEGEPWYPDSMTADLLSIPTRPRPMSPAEHHAERLAFAAKCDGEDDGEGAAPACPACHGPSFPLGVLGNLSHYRCRNCGADYSHSCGEDDGEDDDYLLLSSAGEVLAVSGNSEFGDVDNPPTEKGLIVRVVGEYDPQGEE